MSQRRTSDGLRSVDAAVDPLLRPGDTVHDGAVSWTAGSLEYRIGATEATMTVTEEA